MDKLKELSSIILEWIGVTLPKLKNNLKEDGDLREILENGTILCRLMRKVKSGWIKKYHKHAKIGTYFADGTLSYKSLSLSLSLSFPLSSNVHSTHAHTQTTSQCFCMRVKNIFPCRLISCSMQHIFTVEQQLRN